MFQLRAHNQGPTEENKTRRGKGRMLKNSLVYSSVTVKDDVSFECLLESNRVVKHFGDIKYAGRKSNS